MSETEIIEDIKTKKQILLHLLPGLLIAIVSAIFSYIFYINELPPILGFATAAILVMLPFELLAPRYLERKKNENVKYTDIIKFREKIPTSQFLLLGIGALVWAILVFVFAGSLISDPIQVSLFSWYPDWYMLGYHMVNIDQYSKGMMIFVWFLLLVLFGILAPIAEELYFRGYLLPRMSHLKGWAPLVATILFALYHIWSPWMFVVRVIAIFPFIYVVWWKKNIYLGIFVHCALNILGDSIMIIPLIFG